MQKLIAYLEKGFSFSRKLIIDIFFPLKKDLLIDDVLVVKKIEHSQHES